MTNAHDPAAITHRPIVMGIVNVTPDSFSDGGRSGAPDRAVQHALQLAADGAGLIDIGGESTRPGYTPVSEPEERARVLPVLAALAGATTVPRSIDTTKASVAHAAMQLGATVVNDQWGFQGDPDMAAVVAETGARAVLMHNRATPDDGLTMDTELLHFFERSLAIAARAGVSEHRLILDPGIGFGKTPAQHAEALGAVPALIAAFGLPVLVGVSRKSFLGRITGAPTSDRLAETLAANLWALARGATIFRVHDVAPHVKAFAVCAALAQAERRS